MTRNITIALLRSVLIKGAIRRSGNSIYDAFTVPTDQGIPMPVQGPRGLTVSFPPRPHTDYTLPKLASIVDLPVHPFAGPRLRRDVNHQAARLTNPRSKDLILNIILAMRAIRIIRPDRIIPAGNAMLPHQPFKLLQATVILMPMADKDVSYILRHSKTSLLLLQNPTRQIFHARDLSKQLAIL